MAAPEIEQERRIQGRCARILAKITLVLQALLFHNAWEDEQLREISTRLEHIKERTTLAVAAVVVLGMFIGFFVWSLAR